MFGNLSPGNLLVSWLVTPGNYKRWTSQAKEPLEEEIVQLMVDHGIRDHSQRYVYDKIRNLKRSYMSAREYLMQQGQLTRFIEHKASQNVEKKAQRRCSYFRELSVLFEHNGEVDGPQDESSGELHHNGDSDSNSARKTKTRKNLLQRGQGKRKLRCNPSVTSDEKPKKRGKRGPSYPPSLLSASAPEEDEEVADGNRRSSSFLLPTDMIMTAQRLADQKLKNEEALGKCRLEAEQEREAIKTRAAKLKWRHKLKQEGYSDEDIDYAAPL